DLHIRPAEGRDVTRRSDGCHGGISPTKLPQWVLNGVAINLHLAGAKVDNPVVIDLLRGVEASFHDLIEPERAVADLDRQKRPLGCIPADGWRAGQSGK